MAAAAITVVTLIDELKVVLGDTDGQFFTEAEYTRRILEHIIKEQTFVFQKVATNYFSYQGGELWLWDPDFTGEDDLEYTLNACGSIVVTTGTDSRTQIQVMGARVDFREVVYNLLMYLATNKADMLSQSGGYGSISPEEAYAKLVKMAQYWRGTFAVT